MELMGIAHPTKFDKDDGQMAYATSFASLRGRKEIYVCAT